MILNIPLNPLLIEGTSYLPSKKRGRGCVLRKQTFYHAHGNLYAWQIFFKNLNCYLFFKKNNEDAYDGYDLAGPEDEHPFDEVCLDVGNIRL